MKCRRNPFWLLSPAESYNDGGRLAPCDNLLLLPKQQFAIFNVADV